MHPQYQQFNPFRSPAWRFERVLALTDNRSQPKPASRRYDDQYIHAYRKFLLAWYRHNTEEKRLALFPKNPPLYYAHFLHHHPDKEWRMVLQARLLTKASDEEIGEQLCTLPEAIRWYEALFYNVRDRINSRDYMIKTILGRFSTRSGNRDGSITENQHELCLKLFAYCGGKLILDALIAGFKDVPMPRQAKDVDGWFDRSLTHLLRQRATQAARTFEINRYNVMQLMEITTSLIATERSQQTGGPQNKIEENVEKALKGLEWEVGSEPAQDVFDGAYEIVTGSAVEPRADELLALSNGITPKSLTDVDIKQLPPVKRQRDPIIVRKDEE